MALKSEIIAGKQAQGLEPGSGLPAPGGRPFPDERGAQPDDGAVSDEDVLEALQLRRERSVRLASHLGHRQSDTRLQEPNQVLVEPVVPCALAEVYLGKVVVIVTQAGQRPLKPYTEAENEG